MVDRDIFSWYQVPEDIKSLLILATRHWDNNSESEKYINQALAKAEDCEDVLVAAYRYFFYKNNPAIALQMAQKVLDKVKHSENLPDDWEQLKPILIGRQNDPEIRLYLNAYVASGFVLAKLGKIEQAKEITARVKEIDEKREFGAISVFDILTRPAEDDDE